MLLSLGLCLSVSFSSFCPSFRPSLPIRLSVSLPSRAAPSRVPCVCLFLPSLFSLSFSLSIVIPPLTCACNCRRTCTCQRTHAPQTFYYCNSLTTSASNVAHGMSTKCRISPRVDRINVLLLPAKYCIHGVGYDISMECRTCLLISSSYCACLS